MKSSIIIFEHGKILHKQKSKRVKRKTKQKGKIS